MSDISANIGLPFIAPSQAQKHVTHNEALQVLDAIVQLAVETDQLTQAPTNPSNGQRFVVANGATGDWLGNDGAIAYWQGSGWIYIAPVEGWRAYVVQSATEIVFRNGTWEAVGVSSQPMLGVNATADQNNRLTVASPASLFNNEGAGHQVKINKSSSTDTASSLYQTGFSGRAEFGTAGSDDFSIKVSPDGSTWLEPVRIDSTTGGISGSAIQANPQDTGAGKLARADFAYSPGNAIGPVYQVNGTPTGAVMERGANANGSFVRFADGSQICWSPTFSQDATSAVGALYRWQNRMTWVFPATFSVTPVVIAGNTSNAQLCWGTTQNPSTTQALVSLMSVTSIVNRSCNYIALGHWF